jgi:branched-chain amino acid transport system ATP-binding protein
MLQVRAVATFYGAIQALHGVDLDVAEGEIVTLIGANGAGKSTLLMTICGNPRARAGTIRLEGQDITHLPTHEIVLRGVAQVPEGRRIFPRMSVYENLQMGAIVADPAHFQQDLERVFEMFPRLAERREQRGGTLSGGEQQMLAIGRALMSRPRLLLLDEPSLGLAPALVRSIFESFVTLKNRGIAVLLVEQMAWLGLSICDRAYVLEGGKFLIQGTRDAVRSDARVVEVYLGQVKSRALSR